MRTRSLTRIGIVLLAIGLLAGCKIAVIVVEGGVVSSNDHGTCFSGEVCVYEVQIEAFSDTFIAQPDTGWHFVGWKSGDEFLCQTSESFCELSTVGLSGNETAESIIASDRTFYLMPVFETDVEAVPTEIVTVNGRQWLQPANLTGISREFLKSNCPGPDNVCSGGYRGVDLSGWTWASAKDMYDLFNYYVGATVLTAENGFYAEENSKWFERFLASGWQPMSQIVEQINSWVGLTSTEHSIAVIGTNASTLRDTVSVYALRPGFSPPGLGAWLYRDPN